MNEISMEEFRDTLIKSKSLEDFLDALLKSESKESRDEFIQNFIDPFEANKDFNEARVIFGLDP